MEDVEDEEENEPRANNPKTKKTKRKHLMSLLTKLTDKIYYTKSDHLTDQPVIGIIHGSKKSVLVDAGNCPEMVTGVLKSYKKKTGREIDYAVITHFHWDHVFGMSALSCPTIAHAQTKEQLAKMMEYQWSDAALDERVKNGDEVLFCAEYFKKAYPKDRSNIKIVLPQTTFDTTYELDLGDVTCKIEHIGGTHTDDSSVVFVPEEKTLFLGDCMGYELHNEAVDFEALKKMFRQIKTYGASTYIESHGAPESRADFEEYVDNQLLIGEILNNHKFDLKKAMPQLQEEIDHPLNEYDMDIIRWYTNAKKE